MIEAIIKQHHHDIYTDLDSWFDTRSACLEELDVSLALVNLKNGWDKRIADAPLGLSEQEFRDLYAARDIDTLSLAVQTPVVEIVRHWLLDAIRQLGEVPVKTTLALTINFFPYKMAEQTALVIAEKIREILKINVEINLLNVDPKEITPSVVRARYDAMIMYDGFAWIKSQEQAFELVNCPHTTLYVPKLYPFHLPTSEEVEEAKAQTPDIFRELEVMVGPLVRLEFIPVDIFSAVIPAKLAELELLERS